MCYIYIFFFLLRYHWYTLLRRFHKKNNMVITFTLTGSPPYPTAVTVHQCSKMPQSHYMSSLRYTVFPVTPHTPCAPIMIPHSPLLSLSKPALPHPSLLVITSPFLESVSLLLFCSFSFASLLYSTNEGNHLVFVFLCLTYFTEHNPL